MKIAPILITILILTACSASETTDKPLVKIGASIPLSGDVAFLGESVVNSMELALSELGETKYNYKLIFEDDKLEPRQTSTIMQKFISIDKVDAVVSFSSGTGNVVTPVAQANKIIHFGIASDPNIANGKYNFLHFTPPSEEARVWVEEAQKRGYKKIASISLVQQGVQAAFDEIVDHLVGTDMEIVSDQKFNFKDADFRTIILKAQQSNPDVYFVLAFSPELDNLYKQMKELGIKKPITGIESYGLSNDPSQFEGEWYVDGAQPNNVFLNDYKEKYEKKPALGGPNTYDIVKLIVNAYESTGTTGLKPTTEEVVNTLLETRNFQGALGSLNVGSDGIVWSGAVVREIRNGEPVTIK